MLLDLRARASHQPGHIHLSGSPSHSQSQLGSTRNSNNNGSNNSNKMVPSGHLGRNFSVLASVITMSLQESILEEARKQKNMKEQRGELHLPDPV